MMHVQLFIYIQLNYLWLTKNLYGVPFAGTKLSIRQEKILMNSIVHPEVKEEIIRDVEEHKKAKDTELYVLEAALLIEDGYEAVCDELWYIYASKETRISRLKETRGYSDERIADIMGAQLSDDEYIRHCRYVIDNDGDRNRAFEQIRMILSGEDNEQEK